MSAPTTGCSSDGEESVKADEGALEAASIVAPTTAAIAPRDRMRKTMVASWFPNTSGLCSLITELGVNGSWQIEAFSLPLMSISRPDLRGPYDHRARPGRPQSLHRRLPWRVDRSRTPVAPASRGLADQYAGRARGGDFHHLWPRGLGCGRRHADRGPGRDRHRISWRRRDLQGGPQCAGPQYCGDPLVLGRGWPG